MQPFEPTRSTKDPMLSLFIVSGWSATRVFQRLHFFRASHFFALNFVDTNFELLHDFQLPWDFVISL